MVAQHDGIVTLLVVIPKIMVLSWLALDFHIGVHTTYKVNCFIVQDFCFFIVGESSAPCEIF